MIKSLQIKNIQSHKNTSLEFSKGVNVLIGASNQGKSAILRALYWVRYNRPLGIDTLASHWAVNDKGNLIDTMSVKLVNDKGVVERKRTKDDNQYIVNGDELNVVKTDVPIQVEETLRLSDTNVQKQLDAPFLLSQTSGEVAKYFNQIVNLDIIDKILTNAESKRRKTKNDIESTKSEIDSLKVKLDDYSWIDEAESLLEKYLKLSKRIDEINSEFNYISSSLAMYGKFKNECDEFSKVAKLKLIVDECDSMMKEILDNETSCNEGYRVLSEYDENDDKKTFFDKSISYKSVVKDIEKLLKASEDADNDLSSISQDLVNFKRFNVYDFSTQRKWINKIEILNNEIFDINRSVNELDNLIYDYKEACQNVREIERDLKMLKQDLPKVCPLCGHPIEEDSCEV